MIDISIIIPCKNEEKLIGPTLNSVFNQDIDKGYEVIVIDSGSSDDTLDIVRKYPVKLIEVNSKDFAHARTRNYGTSIAQGKWIIFLNADATPVNEYWIKSLIDNFKDDRRIAGVYSRLYPREDCNPLRSWEILNDNYYFNGKKIKFIDSFGEYNKLNREQKRKFISFHTISCVIRKDFLLKYPFKDMEFGEDLEWSKRMIELGFKIAYEANSKVFHSHNFYHSFTQTIKKYFDDARLNNILLDRWRLTNIHILLAHIGFKLFKDIGYILKLNKSVRYKISWILYSPIIRVAEFYGIVLASFVKLPHKLQCRLSLANQIINQ